jgi:hypothetical protein
LFSLLMNLASDLWCWWCWCWEEPPSMFMIE